LSTSSIGNPQQWAPPLDDGNTGWSYASSHASTVPQWSPPSDGGSTRRVPDVLGGESVSAMEPAPERLEHCGGGARGVPGPGAAMEPADEQREHDKAIRGSMTDLF